MNDPEQQIELMAECVEQMCNLVQAMEKLLNEVIKERDTALDYIQAMESMRKQGE